MIGIIACIAAYRRYQSTGLRILEGRSWFFFGYAENFAMQKMCRFILESETLDSVNSYSIGLALLTSFRN